MPNFFEPTISGFLMVNAKKTVTRVKEITGFER
jgi:hypothetical protein